jgi:hypothetical protein
MAGGAAGAEDVTSIMPASAIAAPLIERFE